MLQTKAAEHQDEGTEGATRERKANLRIVLIGLWQTKDDVEQQLLKLKSEQLKFRKNVLQMQYYDLAVYCFSKKGGVNSHQ